LLLAAINALHEAEEARLPLSARVSAVIAALAGGAPVPADLLQSLEQLARCLQARVDADPPGTDAAADRAALRAAAPWLSAPPESRG
jgi:hypothetical protein